MSIIHQFLKAQKQANYIIFCCEPKTALKNSVLKKKWQAYTFSKHEKEPLFLSSNGGIS